VATNGEPPQCGESAEVGFLGQVIDVARIAQVAEVAADVPLGENDERGRGVTVAGFRVQRGAGDRVVVDAGHAGKRSRLALGDGGAAVRCTITGARTCLRSPAFATATWPHATLPGGYWSLPVRARSRSFIRVNQAL